MDLLPAERERLRGTHPLTLRHTPERAHIFDLSGLYNSPLKGEGWDLTGIKQGPLVSRSDDVAAGVATRFGPGAMVVRRGQVENSPLPLEVTIPVSGQFAKLIFLQSATGKGRPNIHAGDATFFPHESSELLGMYEVEFEDGLRLTADIRSDENVATWNAGLNPMLYHARGIEAGKLPDGTPLVVWAYEWINPRPDVPISAIHFRGAKGLPVEMMTATTTPGAPPATPAPGAAAHSQPSEVSPILLGITGIEKVRLSDYR
jgi:hypothetical protein